MVKKNKILTIAAVLSVILFLFVLLIRENKKEEDNNSISITKSKESVGEDNKSPNVDSIARYIEYTPESFEKLMGKKTVIFFYANWCPTCRPVDQELKNNFDKIPDDVIVMRVNYNDSDTDSDEETLAKKYGITYQHTFVQIDADGTEVQKWNGGGLNTLLNKLSNK